MVVCDVVVVALRFNGQSQDRWPNPLQSKHCVCAVAGAKGRRLGPPLPLPLASFFICCCSCCICFTISTTLDRVVSRVTIFCIGSIAGVETATATVSAKRVFFFFFLLWDFRIGSSSLDSSSVLLQPPRYFITALFAAFKHLSNFRVLLNTSAALPCTLLL